MTFDHDAYDSVLASLAALRTRDVHGRRVERQRARCHALLRHRRSAATGTRLSFRRVVGPALGGAWCLAYLAEIIRRAATTYGF